MANIVEQDITLTVNASNAPSISSPITVILAPAGAPVAWSTGPALSQSSGITLISASPQTPIPLQTFTITATQVQFQTTPGAGGGLNFSLSAYLVADPTITVFRLSYSADQGVTVSATLSGREPVTLQTTPQLYSWNPS